MLEVQALQEQNGGGNRAAAAQWLANVPESMKPSPDSHIDAKKTFIDKAYNKKEWVATGPAPTSTPPSQEKPQTSSKGVAQKAVVSTSSPNKVKAEVSNQVATVNLLDDDAFSAAPQQQAQAPAPPKASAKAAEPSCNLLDDDFFSPAAAPRSTQTVSQSTLPTSSSTTGFDPLGDIQSNDNAGTFGGSAFSFIAGSQGQASQQPAPAQPVVNGLLGNFSGQNSGTPAPSSGSNAASAFSFIAASQGSQPSGQVPFASAPAANAAVPMQQFAGGACAMQGPMFQNQAAYASSSFGFVNSNMAAGGGFCGHPMQMQAPMHAGYAGSGGVPSAMAPGACFGNAPVLPATATGTSGGAAPTGTDASRAPSMSQASSFDPFDPFAPEPIQVRG